MKTIKKLICFLCFCFFTGNLVSAQSLMHSFGMTISAIFGTVKDNYSSSSFAMEQSTITYFPRYNFVENENSSISIGAPVGIGAGIATNTYGNDAGVAFAYDLPIVLDYNIGCKSTMDNQNNFGGYFGVGFGYYKVSISGSQYSNYDGATYGPIVRGGIRLGSSSESWGGHGLTIGMFYKKGMEANKLNTIGFNVLYDL